MADDPRLRLLRLRVEVQRQQASQFPDLASRLEFNQSLRSSGGVRGGVELPQATQGQVDRISAAAGRIGTPLGGVATALRTGLVELPARAIGAIPGRFGASARGVVEDIEQLKEEEEMARPLVSGPQRFVTDLIEFGSEFALARRIPGVGRLLQPGEATAGTAGGRIAQRGLTEGAQFAGFETGLGAAQGESPEEIASRQRSAFVVGGVIGAGGRGVREGFRAARKKALDVAVQSERQARPVGAETFAEPGGQPRRTGPEIGEGRPVTPEQEIAIRRGTTGTEPPNVLDAEAAARQEPRAFGVELRESVDLRLEPEPQAFPFVREPITDPRRLLRDPIITTPPPVQRRQLPPAREPLVTPLPEARPRLPDDVASANRITQRTLDRLISNERGAAQAVPDVLEHKVDLKSLPEHSRRIQQSMDFGGPDVRGIAEGFADATRSVYQATVRRTEGLERATRQLGGRNVPTAQDPGALARYASGSARRAEGFLEFGPAQLDAAGNMVPTGTPGMSQILEPLQGQLNAYRRYSYATRTAELGQRGIETPLSLPDARLEIASVSPAVKQAQQQAVQYRRDLGQYWADAGGISPEGLAKMVELGQNYVPLFRVFRGKDPLTGGGTAGNVGQVVKRIRGSRRHKLGDPIKSDIDLTRRIIRAADQNRVALRLIELAERSPNARGLIERVETTAQGKGIQAQRLKNAASKRGIELNDEVANELAGLSDEGLNITDGVIRVWRNGSRETWRVSPEISKAIQAMAPNEVSLFWKVLGAPAQTLKSGITLNPAFQAFNFTRDTFDAAIQSQFGFKLFVDSFKGLSESIQGTLLGKPSQAYKEFVLGGGGFSTLRGAGRSGQKELLRRIVPQTKARRGLGQLIHPVELLKKFGQPFEEAARMGEFLKAKQRGASTLEGSLAQAEVTVNFLQRGGSSTMQGLSYATAFLNPAIQSLDRFARVGALPVTRALARRAAGATRGQATAEGAKAASKLFAVAFSSISIPSLYFWVTNRDDQEIQDLRKTNSGLIYWFVRGPPKEDGSPGRIHKIPKPFLYGQLFGTGMESMLDRFADDDPEAARRFVEGVREQAFSNMLPTSLQAISAQRRNRTTFFDTPIVPRGLEGVEPRFQSREFTGAIARKLGDKLNISPARIETFYRDVTGTLGVEALQAADRFIDRLDTDGPSPPERVPADFPIVRRFFARSPSQGVEPVRTFYRNSDKAREAANTFRNLSKSNPSRIQRFVDRRRRDLMLAPMYDAARRELAKARQTMEAIRDLPDSAMSPKEKRANIDSILRRIVETTRTINRAAEKIE